MAKSLDKGETKNDCSWAEYTKRFFCYGGSAQGSSHEANDTPCQDASCLCISGKKAKRYLIAAVADGLGSCAFSQYGSSVAVKTVTDYCDTFLKTAKCPTNEEILRLLKEGFEAAWDAIEEKADELHQIPFSFYTTLTVAIYDGKTLNVGHIGDDGIVALTRENKISLITSRHKGDTINSVIPLQAGSSKWQFFTQTFVDGFLLATDGVLDCFVKSDTYHNMVFEPFFTEFLFRNIRSWNDVEASYRDTFLKLLNNSDYLKRVTDDLSLIIVGNPSRLYERTPPKFDLEKWEQEIQSIDQKFEVELYGSETKKSEDRIIEEKKSKQPFRFSKIIRWIKNIGKNNREG